MSSTPVASTIAPRTDTHSLPGIEAMRAIAASAVVAHHLYDLANGGSLFGATLLEGFGEWGVDLFFLLSAYLLCEYFWHPNERRPLRVFYVRRALRIAPAYYACVGVLFALFANRTLILSKFGLAQIAASGSFTHWLFPQPRAHST